jgi:hypothetical protein
MSVKERRGLAEPRWGWSGVAQIVPPQLSRAEIERLLSLLPAHRTPIKRITMELRELGGKYHRYLHQDEFGPSRAERVAALRVVRAQLHVLSSRLVGLPTDLRLGLCRHLAQSATREVLFEMDIGFQAYRNEEEALQQVAEAAFLLRNTMDKPLTSPEAEIVAGLADVSECAAQLLSALDTTTGGAFLEELDLPPLNVTWDQESSFTIVHARIERLFRRIEHALARLEARGGPERAINLGWLVWCLCDLYHRETGKPVTSSAVADYHYKGIPQSLAGRFVLACAEVLQPSEAWMREPDHQVPQRRSRMLNKAAFGRAVYFAMRAYVACHPSARPRSGRRKQVQ